MNTLRRLAYALAASLGLVALTTTAAQAAMNHCHPVHRP